MTRGNASFVQHEVRMTKKEGYATVLSEHPLLNLLPEDFAHACGFNVGIFGTLSARIVERANQTAIRDLRLADLSSRPFEFGSATRDMTTGDTIPSLWKVYSLSLTSLLENYPPKYELVGEWQKPFSKLAHLLLSRDPDIRKELPTSRGRARWIHPEVEHLEPGMRIRYGGQDLLVLSNADFNRLHELGRVMIAPVITGSRLHHTASVNSGRIRVAYERMQAIEPFQSDSIEVLEEVDAETEKLASEACHAALGFMFDRPFRVSRDSFVEYLEQSRQELNEQGRSLVVSPLTEAAPIRMSKHIRVTRSLPSAGRALTPQINVALPGKDTFQVDVSSGYFEVFVERIENRLSLLLDSSRSDRRDNEITFAWAEGPDGTVLASVTPNPESFEPIRLDLGLVLPNVPTDVCLAVSTTYGLGTTRFELQWSTTDIP